MSKNPPWVVYKFGGSSVADAECFRKVAAIVESRPPGPLAVVLSASRGITDALWRMAALAQARDEAWRAELASVRTRHASLASTLLGSGPAGEFGRALEEDCRQ